MTENQQPTDEQILERAQELVAADGIRLADAMIKAEAQLAPKSSIDCTFELSLTLKPRVAKFFREEFSGHPDLSVEDRLGQFLVMQLNRLRGEALARVREDQDVNDHAAVTQRRSTFLERNPTG